MVYRTSTAADQSAQLDRERGAAPWPSNDVSAEVVLVVHQFECTVLERRIGWRNGLLGPASSVVIDHLALLTPHISPDGRTICRAG